jgi:hypothetical protein
MVSLIQGFFKADDNDINAGKYWWASATEVWAGQLRLMEIEIEIELEGGAHGAANTRQLGFNARPVAQVRRDPGGCVGLRQCGQRERAGPP